MIFGLTALSTTTASGSHGRRSILPWRLRRSARYPGADPEVVAIFEQLVSLAEASYLRTGRHLNVTGEIGELFGCIAFGVRLNRMHAQGSDGRLGNHHVEIKTIAPFKAGSRVQVKASGNWSQLLVVRIDPNFEVSGRMIDRSELPKPAGKYYRVRWAELPSVSQRRAM